MLAGWQKFLIKNGAEIEGDDVLHFGAFEREARIICAGTVMADLSHYSILKISGADAGDFLQNQLSNNVEDLKIGESQLSAWCNNKGRVISTLVLLKLEAYYLILLPEELSMKVGQQLAVYVLKSKVKLEKITDQVIIGVSGPKAEEYIVEADIQCPENEYQHTFTNDILSLRIPGLTPRYIIVSNLDNIKDIWGKLDVKSAPVGTNSWKLTNIRAGVPIISADTSEKFVPQMLNLDLIPAVDFKKGCYPGQEVVARMHYLGKAKRRMYHIEIDRSELKENNEQLISKSSDSGQGAGNIVASAINGDGKIEALAVIEEKILEADDITDADSNKIKYMEIQ